MSPNVEEIYVKVENLDKAVFGDRVNPKAMPGALAELAQTNVTLGQMRDSLNEVRSALTRINMTIILGFITALMVVVFKGIQ